MAEFVEGTLPHTIWKERYALPGETKWEQTAQRIARFAAQAERNDEDQVKWYNQFLDLIYNLSFLPGGRIMANAGRARSFPTNCFVLPVADSRESIGDLIRNVLVISGTGGGIGISFRNLRFKGAPIRGAGGESSGPVSFMKAVNAIAEVIKIGGGRRAALMLSLPIDHPDIEEFLHVKLDLDELTNANISVEINNKFLEAVKNNDDWDLVWAGRVVKTVKAIDLWNKIVSNSLQSGEPGILNLDLARKMSNSDHVGLPILTTNPCGEQFLPAFSSCNLASINVCRFISGNRIDEEAFRAAIAVGVRFLDNIIDVSEFPLAENRDAQQKERRLGLGLTSVHSAMLQMGIKYSSNEGLAFVEWLYKTLKEASYEASVDLAIERGAFPMYKPSYLDSPFIKSLPLKIKRRIREHGIRNVCLNTQAPIGTGSMLLQKSSGIEPIFAPIFKRTFFSEESATGRKTEYVVDAEVMQAMNEGRSLDHFEGAYDISPEQHLAIQEVAQLHLDSSISKTINLPKSFSHEELSEKLLKYAPILKGFTIYREGSRKFEPLTPVELNEANLKKATKNEKASAEAQQQQDCPNGVCSL